MFDGAFSFHGRIGRLYFFLAELLMVPAIFVAAFALAFLMAWAQRSTATLVFFGLLALLLVIVACWYSLSLHVRRIRDIGWSPFYVLCGWFVLGCADAVVSMQVPSLALYPQHGGTIVGALANLGLTLALLLWPGHDGDVGDTTSGFAPRPMRLDGLGLASPNRFEAAAPAPLRLPGAPPEGFGRRGVR